MLAHYNFLGQPPSYLRVTEKVSLIYNLFHVKKFILYLNNLKFELELMGFYLFIFMRKTVMI